MLIALSTRFVPTGFVSSVQRHINLIGDGMHSRRSMIFFVAFWVSVIVTSHGFAQNQGEPDTLGMKVLYMSIMTKGPNWNDLSMRGAQAPLRKHFAFWDSLQQKGKVILRGRVDDTSAIKDIIVIELDSLRDAIELTDRDPLVESGWLHPLVLGWYAARKVITSSPGGSPTETYFIALLRRGPKWTPEQNPETAKLQEAHMANIRELARQRKLVLAGPFEDGKELRGVFIFRVPSIADATTLTSGDPAVNAGRLAFDIHPWQVPKGNLP